MSDQRSRALERFGEELREAAAEQIERERLEAAPRAGGGKRPALLLAIGSATLAAAVAATATGVLDRDGDPLPSPGAGPQSPAADPAVVTSAAQPDPDGGAPWTVRVFSNAKGEECVLVGRLKAGRLGIIEGGRFRPFPADAPGTCGGREGLITNRRVQPDPPRTVIYGRSAGKAIVTVDAGSATREVRPAGFGAWLVVLDRTIDEPIVIRTVIGAREIARTISRTPVPDALEP